MTEKIKEGMKISWGILLQLGSVLTITVLSFSLVKGQADENTRSITRNERVDEKHWAHHEVEVREIKNEINAIKSVQTEIRILQREQTTHYIHILDTIEALSVKFDKYKVVE